MRDLCKITKLIPVPAAELEKTHCEIGKNSFMERQQYDITFDKVSLIACFRDAQGGAVKIDGTELKDMGSCEIHRLIGETFQEVYLFDDTIYNNIRCGRPSATEWEILDAAEKAQVLDFALELRDGMQTRTGEGGRGLSDGEKLRVSTARAFLKDTPIILLDEAAASLDPANEQYIQQAILELAKNKTVIVIAHKPAAIQHAQQILVLNEGQVVEQGTHEELLRRKWLYHYLWEMQETIIPFHPPQRSTQDHISKAK